MNGAVDCETFGAVKAPVTEKWVTDSGDPLFVW